ncbi:uncharacterized protein BJ171DRAFT_453887 [Polychytrium aggregatum]|uniref:uncharacterized protein n=1 Tax=Polychytrium aggregatum TaxID=110093 RepID=UPI0022FF03C7|nr:uncharacterized protein BJ171DRAFT_453887 [Polychytrium aggregatum]KAI9209721.1 hypothetical protein BJ171DRAFT_453887 [Polychytrium aggregatum]
MSLIRSLRPLALAIQPALSASGVRHIPIRAYATHKGVLTPERARYVEQNPPRSRRGVPLDERRTFLFEFYSEILAQPTFFVFNVFNPSASEYAELKRQFKKQGFDLTMARNGVFSAAIKAAAAESGNPALLELRSLFTGQCCVASSNVAESERPRLTAEFMTLADKFKDSILVVGGKLETTALSLDQLNHVKTLPGLSHLRAEIVGLLSYPAQSLVSTLNTAPSTLILSLQQHEKNLDPAAAESS